MTIEIQLSLGMAGIEKKIYRNVAQHNRSAYVAGFFANRDNYKWGKMIQLKGNERIVLHTFGKVE